MPVMESVPVTALVLVTALELETGLVREPLWYMPLSALLVMRVQVRLLLIV